MRISSCWPTGARQAGLKLIQILPVNDTTATHTWTDSYPYAAISAFALHPLYLNLAAVADVKNKKLLAALEPERRRLNALDDGGLRGRDEGQAWFHQTNFPVAKGGDFSQLGITGNFSPKTGIGWSPTPCSVTCATNMEPRISTNGLPIGVTNRRKRTNWLPKIPRRTTTSRFIISSNTTCTGSSRRRRNMPMQRGVILKGDIAIGVYRHGADVWCEPELFHMDTQAGAPPDAFAAKGQNWGFPDLQLAAHEGRRLRVVEAPIRADELLFRRLSH